jgi:predicted GIY-YIG superfamily endonuclease
MLVDPTGKDTCYIGCSQDVQKRFKAHLYDISTSTAKRRWIASLKRKKLKPILIILDTVLSQEAVQAERDCIAIVRAVRGKNLLNTTRRY